MRIAKWAAYAVALLSVVAIATALPLDRLSTDVTEWIDSLGVWGPVAFGGVYIVATVLFVPGTFLTLAAGALYGLLNGFIIVSLSSTMGAALAFLIARYFARSKVEAMASRNRHAQAIDSAIEEGGWKVVGLLRLSPAIPFNLQNYLYGLTRLNFWQYVVASWIAMMPGTFMYVYLGHVSGTALSGTRERTMGEWVMLTVGLLATIAVTVYLTRLARRKLKEDVDHAVVSDDGERDSEDKPRRAPLPVVPMAVALPLLAAAVAVRANVEYVRSYVASLLGPPAVTMAEKYERKPDDGPSMKHDTLDRLLRAHVDDAGWVDYQTLSSEADKLQDYIEQVADSPFVEMGRDQKLALLINAYNAFTMALVVEHMPIESIMDIPKSERWAAQRWDIGGETYSLNEIEHELIRQNFREPRIHFALVCAAVGCPPLRNEAYLPDRLEQQLDSQAEYVHQHPTWYQFDPTVEEPDLKLTKLYKWYQGDFAQVAGSVIKYAARYDDRLASYIEDSDSAKLSPTWLAYDWALNSYENRRDR